MASMKSRFKPAHVPKLHMLAGALGSIYPPYQLMIGFRIFELWIKLKNTFQ